MKYDQNALFNYRIRLFDSTYVKNQVKLQTKYPYFDYFQRYISIYIKMSISSKRVSMMFTQYYQISSLKIKHKRVTFNMIVKKKYFFFLGRVSVKYYQLNLPHIGNLKKYCGSTAIMTPETELTSVKIFRLSIYRYTGCP